MCVRNIGSISQTSLPGKIKKFENEKIVSNDPGCLEESGINFYAFENEIGR